MFLDEYDYLDYMNSHCTECGHYSDETRWLDRERNLRLCENCLPFYQDHEDAIEDAQDRLDGIKTDIQIALQELSEGKDIARNQEFLIEFEQDLVETQQELRELLANRPQERLK